MSLPWQVLPTQSLHRTGREQARQHRQRNPDHDEVRRPEPDSRLGLPADPTHPGTQERLEQVRRTGRDDPHRDRTPAGQPDERQRKQAERDRGEHREHRCQNTHDPARGQEVADRDPLPAGEPAPHGDVRTPEHRSGPASDEPVQLGGERRDHRDQRDDQRDQIQIVQSPRPPISDVRPPLLGLSQVAATHITSKAV
jgi:hypothetical protein